MMDTLETASIAIEKAGDPNVPLMYQQQWVQIAQARALVDIAHSLRVLAGRP